MRAVALVALVLAACTAPAPATSTPTPTPERGALTVAVLLDLSGPRSGIGGQQRNALQLWTDQQARTAVPVRVRTVDVAGSDAKLLIELRRAATDPATDAVVLGPPTAYDDTIGRAIEIAALPVLFTEPVAREDGWRGGGHWAFALAPSVERLAAAQLDDAARRGVLSPSLVLADLRDRLDPVVAALAAELERRHLDPLTRIAMPADGAVPPVVRSSLSVLRSVHCMGPISGCSTLAREAKAAGSPALVYLPYFATPADLKDDRDLAARAIWPSSRQLVPPATQRTPADQMRAAFLKAYDERYGTASVHAAVAYDALSLIAAAGARASDDRTVLRDALERITMPLIASTYAFSADRHAGADPADLAYVRWDGGGPVLWPP